MTWQEQRARFPVLERFAYLNAGTFGPLARTTLAAMAELRAWEARLNRGLRRRRVVGADDEVAIGQCGGFGHVVFLRWAVGALYRFRLSG